jgi:hypothetical protein
MSLVTFPAKHSFQDEHKNDERVILQYIDLPLSISVMKTIVTGYTYIIVNENLSKSEKRKAVTLAMKHHLKRPNHSFIIKQNQCYIDRKSGA